MQISRFDNINSYTFKGRYITNYQDMKGRGTSVIDDDTIDSQILRTIYPMLLAISETIQKKEPVLAGIDKPNRIIALNNGEFALSTMNNSLILMKFYGTHSNNLASLNLNKDNVPERSKKMLEECIKLTEKILCYPDETAQDYKNADNMASEMKDIFYQDLVKFFPGGPKDEFTILG